MRLKISRYTFFSQKTCDNNLSDLTKDQSQFTSDANEDIILTRAHERNDDVIERQLPSPTPMVTAHDADVKPDVTDVKPEVESMMTDDQQIFIHSLL